MRSTACRVSLLTTLLAAGLLAFSASAFGAIDLGPSGEPPVIAYEPLTQTTYVAWRGPELHSIELCVLASGASGCTGGTYDLKDEAAGASTVYATPQIVIEPGGGAVVVANLAGVNEAIAPKEYSEVGVVAWSSVAGGASFGAPGQGLADHGELLAPDINDGDPPGAGAVALGGANVGVFGNSYPFSDAFAAFNLTEPAPHKLPKPDTSELFGQDLAADSGQVAALLNTPKAEEDLVVTVGAGPFTKVPACPSSEQHTGYAVADATLANLNTQAAWEVQGPYFKPIDCLAKSPVLAGGPSGIGVFEDEGPGLQGPGADGVDYRPFEPATLSFGAPVQVSDETAVTLLGANDLSLSQDSSGGIYAMWLDRNGVELSYSNTAGASWQAPVSAQVAEAGDPVIAGVGAGNAEVAYTANLGGGSQEYLQLINSTSNAGNSQTVTVGGDNVSLSAPSQCVRNGLVNSQVKVALPSAKRKGKVVVKIYEVIFKVAGETVTIKRTHLSDAPFKVTIHLKHIKPGTKLVLTAHALIAVKKGPKRSKTLKITLTSCA